VCGRTRAAVLLAALLLLGGCVRSRVDDDVARAFRPRKAESAEAELHVSGGVITQQAGSRFEYRGKCSVCGCLGPAQVCPSFHSVGWTYRARFRCPKCGRTQDVIIRRGGE